MTAGVFSLPAVEIEPELTIWKAKMAARPCAIAQADSDGGCTWADKPGRIRNPGDDFYAQMAADPLAACGFSAWLDLDSAPLNRLRC